MGGGGKRGGQFPSFRRKGKGLYLYFSTVRGGPFGEERKGALFLLSNHFGEKEKGRGEGFRNSCDEISSSNWRGAAKAKRGEKRGGGSVTDS